MISARDPLQGRALGVPPGHGEVLIIIIVVCEGRPVYPNVVCSSQLHVEVRLDTAPHIANCPKYQIATAMALTSLLTASLFVISTQPATLLKGIPAICFAGKCRGTKH